MRRQYKEYNCNTDVSLETCEQLKMKTYWKIEKTVYVRCQQRWVRDMATLLTTLVSLYNNNRISVDKIYTP